MYLVAASWSAQQEVQTDVDAIKTDHLYVNNKVNVGGAKSDTWTFVTPKSHCGGVCNYKMYQSI